MFDYSHRKDCLLSLNDILCISVWIGGWDYSSPSSGLGISPCWTSRVLVGPFVWPVKAPLYGSMSLCCISPSSQFFIVCTFAEGVLSPIIQVSNGKVQVWTPVSTLGCTSGLKSPVRFHVSGHKPLISTARPTSTLFYTVHTWAVHLWECYGGQCWKSCQIQG